MAGENHQPPGLGTLTRRLVSTGLGALRNRSELLAVEWQEERARLAELLVRLVGFVFFAMMGMMLLTATIIFLFPADQRIYVTAGFTVLYLVGAIVVWFGLKSLLKQEPFAATIDQVKKDRVWLESSE